MKLHHCRTGTATHLRAPVVFAFLRHAHVQVKEVKYKGFSPEGSSRSRATGTPREMMRRSRAVSPIDIAVVTRLDSSCNSFV